MFTLTDKPIEPPASFAHEAGGFVTFEGRVRNKTHGRSVTRLEYEAFPEMALPEGEALVQEAVERFGLVKAAIIHRVGSLALGEMAVWIGTAAPHRREAFAACEWLIDELKHRVPIWKKEVFADGESDWVGSGDGAAFQTPKSLDTSRLEILSEIGAQGMTKLAQARVLLVGVGGLGSGSLPHLAGSGIGVIGLCDPDRIELSNLHRQTIYASDDEGRLKVDRAAAFVKRINPGCLVHTHPETIDEGNVDRLVSSYDWVVDGTDSLDVKFILNAACRRQKKPLVTSSIHKFEGQLMTVSPEGPCLNCLFPEPPPQGCVGTCAQEGVLGCLPGFFGTLQAAEVIKGITGFGPRLDQEMLLFDLRTSESMKIRRVRREGCPGCHGQLASTGYELNSLSQAEATLGRFTLIDIRERDEEPPLKVDHLRIPLSEWALPSTEGPLLICCSAGVRSLQLTIRLRSEGREDVFSLKRGLEALKEGHASSQ
jgi:molybdopterin/thiamine biosynthesis adenylyltransferase/molybdopterin synthase catalytic subunit